MGKLSIIVAADPNDGIGKDGALPWKIRSEMQFFKRTTMGKPIIMGRGTYHSIGEKPLPGRENFVVSSTPPPGDVWWIRDFQKAIRREFEGLNAPEIMVIGGAQLYAAALPYADRIYLSRIKQEYDCDTFFPTVDWSRWDQVGVGERTDWNLEVYNRRTE